MMIPSISLFKKTVTRNGITTKTSTWYMGYKDENGKTIHKPTGTKSKNIAQIIARKLTEDISLGHCGIAPPKDKDFKAAQKEFLEYCGTKSVDTVDLYRRCSNLFYKAMNPKSLRVIDTKMVEDYAVKRRNQTIVMRGKEKKVSPFTVNRDIRQLRTFLKWCQRRNYIGTIPNFKGAFQREPQLSPVVVPETWYKSILSTLDDAEFTAKLYYCSADWWRVFVTLAWELGLRRSELTGLKWEQVDTKNKVCLVSHLTSKGKKDRMLPLMDSVVSLLNSWKKTQEAQNGKTEKVLPWVHGQRQLYNDWDRIIKQAKLPGRVVPKHFRSTTASMLLMSGADTVSVRDFLGHSTVAVLERHYASISADALRKAAERRKAAEGPQEES